MENISLIKDLVSPADFLASFDLKEAYFSIPIFSLIAKICFFWGGELFQFTCIPIGYSLAPRVFTKVLKPVLAFIHFKDISAIISIDDILVIAVTADEYRQYRSLLIERLESLGIKINFEKSHLTPRQILVFLGFTIDTTCMKLFLLDVKVTKVKSTCQTLLDKEVSLVEIAHVTGLLVSAFPAVHYPLLFYRSIEYCKSRELHEGAFFDKVVSLSTQSKTDLTSIINIDDFNGKPVRVYVEQFVGFIIN